MDPRAERAARITARYERAKRYAKSDPEVALAEARKAAEAIARALYKSIQAEKPEHRSFRKQADGLMLGVMVSSLKTDDRIPRVVITSFGSIQAYGNIGAHDQGAQSDHVCENTVQACISALDVVYEWYLRDLGAEGMPVATQAPKRSRRVWYGAGAVLLALAGGALWYHQRSSTMHDEPELVSTVGALQEALLELEAPVIPDPCLPTDPVEAKVLLEAATLLAGGSAGSARPEDHRAKALLEAETQGVSAAHPALLALAEQQISGPSRTSERPALQAQQGCGQWALPSNLLGNVHLAAGELEQASEAYRAALAVATGYAPPRFNLALVALKSGDAAAAERELTTLLEHHPRHPNARLVRAQARAQLRDLQGAEQDARAAAQQAPEDPAAHALLGSLLRVVGDSTGSKAALCRAQELGHPDIDPALDCNGQTP